VLALFRPVQGKAGQRQGHSDPASQDHDNTRQQQGRQKQRNPDQQPAAGKQQEGRHEAALRQVACALPARPGGKDETKDEKGKHARGNQHRVQEGWWEP
jgi:hypothetical protein